MALEYSYQDLRKKLASVDRNILLVSGKSLEKTGILDKVPELALSNVVRFSDFTENPELKEVIDGLELFNSSNVGLIIAVGGGSAIDIAKLIKYYSKTDIFEGIEEPPVVNLAGVCEFIAIPTTFGTGSEATHFSVLYVNGVKYSVADKSILPDGFLLDYELANSLPKRVKASAALDALCQSIESYWSNGSTIESRSFASRAIETLVPNFEDYISGNRNAAQSISIAAHLAGKAINISKTTAPHALSYTLTSKFGVSHGHAVALCIRKIFKLHESKDLSLGIHSKQMELYGLMGVDSAQQAEELLNGFMQLADLEIDLACLGLYTDEDIQMVVSSVNAERLANHPVDLTKCDLISLFRGKKY